MHGLTRHVARGGDECRAWSDEGQRELQLVGRSAMSGTADRRLGLTGQNPAVRDKAEPYGQDPCSSTISCERQPSEGNRWSPRYGPDVSAPPATEGSQRMTSVRKLAYGLATLASATALALSPSAAVARATGTIAGHTYEDCYEAFGWYEWKADESGGGYPKYDTDGEVTVAWYRNCDSWLDGAVLQYSGKKWQGGSWTTFGWKNLPAYGHDVGESFYSLKFNDVRDLRFKVCNVHNGIEDGCGPVS